MATLDFQNKTLERLYRSFKWARNNSLQLLDIAQKSQKLDWTPQGDGQHSVLYQFQCMVTTTDTYIRKLQNSADARFGVLIHDGQVIKKNDLTVVQVKSLLKDQLRQLELQLKNFSDQELEDLVQDIQSVANHEYLHQGQIVVMFRQASLSIPERFKTAFDL